eukprot:Hpha_TRINITY_DN12660_c0_g1::TRINITY_DN12660_c0_g1_i1::g.49706::m.49706
MARIPSARWYTGDRMYAMAAVPSGRLFVGGAASGEIKVYDPRSGRLEATLDSASDSLAREGGHTDAVLSIVYNSANLFTAAADGLIMMWDLTTLQCVRAFRGHTGLVAALCLIPSEMNTGLFSGSDDCTIRQWNTLTGKCVATYSGTIKCMPSICRKRGQGAVNAVVASTQHLFTGSMRSIQVWLQRGQRCIHTVEAHTDAIWVLRLTQDQKMLSGSSDATIKLWTNLTSGPVCTRVLTGHQGQVRDLILHGPVLFSASKDGTVAVWDMSTWKVAEVLTGHERTVSAISLKNNQLCTCSFDKHINRWDLTVPLTAMEAEQNVVDFVPFDSDAALRERAKREEELGMKGRSEGRYYTRETKRKLAKMKVSDAIFHYEALPINFVIDKLQYKVEASYLVLDTFVFVPFLIMFIFFFYFEAKVEEPHFISRAALDTFEGTEIPRQPWCTPAWNNSGPYRPICNPEVGVLKNEKFFGDITGKGDFDAWLSLVVFPSLWPGEGHADNSPPSRDPPLRGADYLIGALRIRSFRVTSSSCSVDESVLGNATDRDLATKSGLHAALRSFYTSCWGQWSPGREAKEPYACSEILSPCPHAGYPPTGRFNRTLHVENQRGVTKAWAEKWFAPTGFRHFSGQQLGGLPTVGDNEDSWPAGGYAVEVPFKSTPNDARDMIASVVDNGFVDDVATRYIAVEYFTYTPYSNLFGSHRYFIEVATGGSWYPEGKVRFFKVWTKNFIGKMVFDVVFFCYVLFYVQRFLREWYLEWKASNSLIKYILSPWNFIEFMNLGTFFATFVFRCIWWALSIRYDEDVVIPSDINDYPYRLERLREVWLAQVYSNSVNLVLTFLKVLRFVALNDRLNILTRTISHSQSNIFGCLVLFVWTTTTYAITGHAIYGGALFDYRTISASMSAVWRIVGIGDFDYEELRQEQKEMTPIYFWTANIICLFILLNFIIAVLSDSFTEVSKESANVDLDATLKKTLRDVKYEMVPSALVRKLRLLRHRQTQTGLLAKVRLALRENFRNRMLTEDEIEAQEHRELLGEVFVEKEDFFATIPANLRNDLSIDFLQHVWLDLAWEYHKHMLASSSQDDEVRKAMAEDHAEDQIARLRNYTVMIQDVRGRMDDLHERVASIVRTWHGSSYGR